MRIPLTKVYRAFPELDRFSDRQCERFVRAACRLRWRAAHGAVVLLIWLVLAGGFLGLIGWTWRWAGTVGAQSDLRESLAYAVVVAGVALPVLSALLVRDRLLRARIRRLLRRRGSCVRCRYSLLGLPVGEDLRVGCPECGEVTEVDPALAELSVDEQGQARFTPGDRPTPGFWTPHRVRLARRVGVVIMVLLAVGLPALLGVHELRIRRQAERAKADLAGPEGLAAFMEAHQPDGTTPDDPNAWDLFDAAERLRAQVAADWSDQHGEVPDMTWIYGRGDLEDEAERARAEEQARLAADLLETYRARGVLDAFDRARLARRAIWPIQWAQGQSPFVALLPYLGPARNWAKLNTARMHQAARAGDRDEYVRALEGCAALARMVRHQPFLIDALVAAAIESLASSELRRTIGAWSEPDDLDAIARAWEGFEPGLPRSYPFQGERLGALETIAWMFSEPARVRWGSLGAARALASLGTGGVVGRLGTYGENVRAVSAFFDRAIEAAEADPFERAGPVDPDQTGLILPDLLLPAVVSALRAMDAAEAARRGIAVMLAVERHRARTGSLPDSLQDLVPKYLPAVPIDPWDGRAMKFRRVDPASDPLGRDYLLYSVGLDGQDDGGRVPEDPRRRAAVARHPGQAAGFDLVINDPQR